MKALIPKINKATETYYKNTALRAAINAIPYIGGPIDVIISSKGSKIIQERMNYLLNSLKDEMISLKSKVIDKNYLESEEFFDLFVKIMDASIKTRHRIKIDYYTKLFSNYLPLQDRITFSPEDYLNILIELEPREIELMKIIFSHEKYISNIYTELETIDIDKLTEKCFPLAKEDVEFIILRLMRVGLLIPVTGYGLGVEYSISGTFRKIMKLIIPEI